MADGLGSSATGPHDICSQRLGANMAASQGSASTWVLPKFWFGVKGYLEAGMESCHPDAGAT